MRGLPTEQNAHRVRVYATSQVPSGATARPLVTLAKYDTSPAVKNTVTHTTRLVAQDAPLEALGLGLRLPAAGPARNLHYTVRERPCGSRPRFGRFARVRDLGGRRVRGLATI